MTVKEVADKSGLGKNRIYQAIHALKIGQKNKYGFFEISDNEFKKIMSRKGMRGKDIQKVVV